MRSVGVSIIIPVKNEEENIAPLVSELKQLTMNDNGFKIYEILFVDDESTDGTMERVMKCSDGFPMINAVSLHGLRGKGAAIKTGIKSSRGDVLVTMDGDLQHSPLQIEGLIKPILKNEADIVVGARNHENYSFYRKMLSLSNSWLFNHLFKFNLTTPNEGFKAIRRDAITNLDVKANDFDFDLEFLVKARAAGLRITEIPVTLRKRERGRSKVNTVKVTLVFLKSMITLWLEQRKRR